MSFFSRLFGKPPALPTPSPDAQAPAAHEEPLIPVPVPALCAMLIHLEGKKGAALSEAEVLEIRDKAVCIMLPLSKARRMDEARGYADIDPENVWAEWQELRAALADGPG